MEKNNDLNNLRHSAAHLLAAAVMELYPNTKHTIGPVIDEGFYYDFDFASPISENELGKIEDKMRLLAPTWNKFERREVSPEEAKKMFADNPFKLELIEEIIKAGQKISLYTAGNFTDLCRGGHTDNPGQDLQHFKLLSLAGAYWRGDEKNKMLTRIYGTAFATADEMNVYLNNLEQSKKRDHRKIGKEMELFTFDDLVGKGLPLWLPNGTIIKNEIEKLAIEMENADGYQRVSTPHMAKEPLFQMSRHLPYYKDSMYPAMQMDDGTYYLKPMNCPHHHLIYLSKPRSYRDLPVRLAEYGTCYRNELSGALAGLLRVRMLSMNDGHIYVRADQIEEEVAKVMQLTQKYFQLFGLNDYWFRLSLWDPAHKEKYIDQPENWSMTEDILRQLLKKMNVKFEEVSDEAAFYGPKIDVQFRSVIGREESMSTIQLDFLAKERFHLSYTDSTGALNNQVFVIHRAPLSTHERFLCFLIEHYAGNFPLWLAPIQVILLPVSDKFTESAHKLAANWKAQGIRVTIDDGNETLGNRIRKAAGQKIPYQIVLGQKEVDGGDLQVRIRGQEQLVNIESEALLNKLRELITGRSGELKL
ncbi:MAG: threonine--tRNA ligase [Candidatus Komeilibacteria bacterium]